MKRSKKINEVIETRSKIINELLAEAGSKEDVNEILAWQLILILYESFGIDSIAELMGSVDCEDEEESEKLKFYILSKIVL